MKWAFPNNIVRTKVNYIANILRKNCLFLYAIERQMMDVKVVGGRRKRRIQFPDGLKNRGHWELNEKAED